MLRRTLALMLFIIWVFTTAIYASPYDNARLDVETVGRTEQVKITSYLDQSNNLQIYEEHGENVSGEFIVSPEEFSAIISFENDDIKYNLYGQNKYTDLENSVFAYEGNCIDDEHIKFEAVIARNNLRGKYDATVNIYYYPDPNNIEKVEVKTLTFNGKKAWTESYQSSIHQLSNDNDAELLSSCTDPWCEDILGSGFWGGSVRVTGKNTVYQGGSIPLYFRHATDSRAIEEYWNNEPGYIVHYEGSRIKDYKVKVSSNGAGYFSALSPSSNSNTSFSIPIYLPYIGLTYVPVDATGLDMTVGNSNANWDFYWSFLFGGGYVDDSNLWTDPPQDKGFGFSTQWNTLYDTPIGTKRITFDTTLIYGTYVFKQGYPLWVYKEVSSTNDLFSVNVIKN